LGLLAWLLAGCDGRPASPPPIQPKPSVPAAAPALPPPAQPPAAPQERDEPIRGALTIREIDGRFSYHLRGQTRLPDGASVKVILHYVSVDREGREDITTVWHNDNAVQGVARAERGAFELALGSYVREPYPIHYRAEILYDPDLQDREVARQFSEPITAWVDLPAAPEAVMRPRLERMKVETVADFDALEALFVELRGKFGAIQSGALAPAEWDAWKEGFLDRLDELRAINAARFEVWAVWTERSAKLNLKFLHEMLMDLVAQGSKILETPPSERAGPLAESKRDMDVFVKNLSNLRDMLQLEKPPGPEVREALDHLDALLAQAEQAPADRREAALRDLRPKLASLFLNVGQGMPVRGQEPVQAAAAAAADWVEAAAASARAPQDPAAQARLADARRAWDTARAALRRWFAEP
jgi:hypothetical protein